MRSPPVADRWGALRPSPTIEMSERVRVARASGREVISLSSGDPNLPTDPRIVEAAERAMRDGRTHYASPAGEPALREAIARREAERSGAVYDPGDVLVTPGGKFALLTALMGVVNPGDEVLVPDPGWVSFGPCVRLAGGTPVAVRMNGPGVEALERAITPRTKALIVNSPANPTGQVLEEAEVAQLVDVARRHEAWLIFDQVYADLVYEGAGAFPQVSPGGFERTLVVDSLSKSFAMTGWRLGYLAAPPGLTRVLVRFLQHSVYCVPPFVQAAGTRALELSQELLPGYRELFRTRVVRAAASLSTIEGLTCPLPAASFHLFPGVQGNEIRIARRWLDEADVAVLPGSAFGAAGAGHLRLSLTCPEDLLETAFDRIARAGIGASPIGASVEDR